MVDVSEQEPCDWCGRPGRVRQHEYWRSHVLVCRNRSLCDVCEFLRDLPGEVGDAIDDAGLDYDAVQLALEAELEWKWREKVAARVRPSDAWPNRGRRLSFKKPATTAATATTSV